MVIGRALRRISHTAEETVAASNLREIGPKQRASPSPAKPARHWVLSTTGHRTKHSCTSFAFVELVGGSHMRTFDLITLLAPEVASSKTKIHLACWNGNEDPLDLLRIDTFDPWQASQNNKNFERE